MNCCLKQWVGPTLLDGQVTYKLLMIQSPPIKAVPMATTPNASEHASALAPNGESRLAIPP
jgi:hypothetical protein